MADHSQNQETEQNRITLTENSLKLPSLGELFRKWEVFTGYCNTQVKMKLSVCKNVSWNHLQ